LNGLKLVFSIGICQLAGVVGAVFTQRSVSTWFATLQKPWFAPPNWVFAPVWITLYFLMGLSLYLLLLENFGEKRVKQGILVFGLQLTVNAGWSFFFFGLQNTFLGFIVITLLLGLIVLTIALLQQINRWSAYLLLPYLLWIGFATVVSFYIWRLNP
jgi:tryptophan-rich sensory protein